MNSKELLSGVWTALITPFDSTGAVDHSAFEKLLDQQLQANITGILLCGSTGEALTLRVSEKLALIKRARAFMGDKAKLMVGCGGSDTHQSVELAGLCVDAGAQSLLVVTPPYNKPPLGGLIAHFRSVCQAISQDIPVVVYHIPSRTGQSLSPAWLTELLASHPSLKGVKEASSNPIVFSRHLTSAQQADLDIAWLSGDDHGFLPTLSVGGAGIISVTSGVFPDAMMALWNAYQAGNITLATQIHQTLFPFMDALFGEVNPLGVKAMLSEIDLCPPHHRLPLVPAAMSTTKVLFPLYGQVKLQLAELTS
ncbi:MAG: 4-hydroxy-tetrahydrodipicolinate synthase [Proteobacteria bacterium]|nr:4-hydroxy-tetrahydrodipicolinate synthase [Pseudomonadota bacterium]